MNLKRTKWDNILNNQKKIIEYNKTSEMIQKIIEGIVGIQSNKIIRYR